MVVHSRQRYGDGWAAGANGSTCHRPTSDVIAANGAAADPQLDQKGKQDVAQAGYRRLNHVGKEGGEREPVGCVASRSVGVKLVESQVDPTDDKTRPEHCAVRAFNEANGPHDE